MTRMTTGLLVAALTISACGVDAGGIDLPTDDDFPLLQIRSEGGFAPVEFVLGRGPTYTLVADGRLISEGPVIAIHPGPLVPNYQVVRIDDDQMRSVLDVVDQMGLPDITDVYDDTATANVADATTEIVTYWDENGAHRYSVYALGILDNASARPETVALQDLLVLLDQFVASGDSAAYSGEQVQYVVGPGWANSELQDFRDWPLDNTDFTGWKTLPNGWQCTVQSGSVPPVFDDATTATQWNDPETGDPLKLLVRPLLPGEHTCFSN